MADSAVNEGGAAPITPPITETPEFKEALAREREQHRLNLEAEYRRKTQDLEAQFAGKTQPPAANGVDFFEDWGTKHGLPAAAGKELVEGVIGYVQGQILPAALKPLSESSKRQELRSQRTELRSSNPRLSKLDDTYHAKAMEMLDRMQPHLIGQDSYVRALHMVIGQNIEEIEAAAGKAGAAPSARQAEVAPGLEPLPASGSGKAGKITLTAKQQQFCEEKGFGAEDFVEMMRDRARKLEANGLSKLQVRGRLGELLGSIEF